MVSQNQKTVLNNSEDCENNEFLEPEYKYLQKMIPFMAAINSNCSLNH